MDTFIFIPARGGSRGVPGKNMKLLGARPLLWYTIQKADYLKSKYNYQWAVTTDCPITYSYALMLGGIDLGLRPIEHSSSTSPTYSSLSFHLNSAHISHKINRILVLQPTTPFTTKMELDEALELADLFPSHCLEHGLVSVRSVPHEFNANWQYKQVLDNPTTITSVLALNPQTEVVPRRQDLPKTFYRSGSIYITSRNLLFSNRVLGSQPLALCVDGMGYSINIDTQADWKQADSYVRHFRFFI